MAKLSYIALVFGVMAVMLVLGFASDQLGPFAVVILLIVVLGLFAVVALTSSKSKNPIPDSIGLPSSQAGWADESSLANKNWIDLVIGHEEMTRHISIEIDRSRRFDRTFTVLVVAPDMKALASDVDSPLDGESIRLFVQEVVVRQLRTTDVISNSVTPSVTIALLPETDSAGANIAVARIRSVLAESNLSLGSKGSVDLSVAVSAVNYPGDVRDTLGIIELIQEFESRVSADAGPAA